MLNVTNQDHYAKVRAFAKECGYEAALDKTLDYLGTYAEHGDVGKTRCDLGWDFAFQSFSFLMYRRQEDGEYRLWFNGGCIYSGPRTPLDGSGPQFTVSLDPSSEPRWSVHT